MPVPEIAAIPLAEGPRVEGGRARAGRLKGPDRRNLDRPGYHVGRWIDVGEDRRLALVLVHGKLEYRVLAARAHVDIDGQGQNLADSDFRSLGFDE